MTKDKIIEYLSGKNLNIFRQVFVKDETVNRKSLSNQDCNYLPYFFLPS